MISAGAAETLNPARMINFPDQLRCLQLYDQLFRIGPDVRTPQPALALEAESNRDATVWTIRLRDGVTWHDGKPFDADDVIYSFRQWSDPSSYANGQVAGLVDFERIRKRDPLTVEIPLIRAAGQFPTILTKNQLVILPRGASERQITTSPIGTGPFRFESFQAGRQSVFSANRDYWEEGKPYVDQLIVDSSFTDETARRNALLSGAINVAPFLAPLVARSLETSGQAVLLRSPSVVQYWFMMRVDSGPFSDVRVRQAMKLIADRPALINGALAGYGTVANDLMGVATEYYDERLPQREQDIEQAMSLLRAAGQQDLAFELPTCGVLPGFTPAATLLAEQAAQAGVDIRIRREPDSTYYTDAGGFMKRPIGVEGGAPYQSLTQVYRTWFTRDAPFNQTHWGSQPGGAAKLSLIDDAISAADPARAEQLWAEVQRQQYEEGGVLGWGNLDDLAGVSPNVNGVEVTLSGYMNNFRLTDAWIAES